MARIKLDGVEKVYDNGFHAVHNLDLDVPDGEFLVLVGPSGCGKSTALRMVAGLESISAGRLYIDDRDVTELEPKDRDIAMVFQSYALYPHLTVRDNIAFALKLRKVPKEEIARKVDEAARLLELTDQLDRRPGQLSGGQRQRVAMGRAIVRAPKVFLMDEPLSNLDAKLRVQMRAEISKLQRSLGVTTIYVTHDQVEAMTMGDRVAVLWAGRLQQVASPQELYDRPDNAFVAGFIGSPSMNLLIGAVQRRGDGWSVQLGEQSLGLPADVVAERPALAGYDGRKIIVGIRPEHVHDVALRDGVARLHGEVQVRESLGSEVVLHLEIGATKAAVGVDEAGGSAFIARLDPRTALRAGDHAELAVDTQYVQLFDAESGQAIRG